MQANQKNNKEELLLADQEDNPNDQFIDNIRLYICVLYQMLADYK